MSISKVRLPNNTEEDIKAKYLIQSTSADAVSAEFSARTMSEDAIANIQKIYGNTVKWNQLNKANSATSESGGITFTNNGNGSFTCGGTCTTLVTKSTTLSSSFPQIISGHIYVLRGCPSGGNISSGYVLRNPAGTIYDQGDGLRFTSSSTSSLEIDMAFRAGTYSNITFWPQLIDLTAIYGSGNEPTLSEFKAQYPASYYPYDSGSLTSNSATAILSRGFNQWDEQWESGSYSSETGAKESSPSSIRSKNLIPILPSTQYYLNVGSHAIRERFYDKSGQYIGYSGQRTDRGSITTPASAYYMALIILNTTTYANTICINISDTTKNGTYEPYNGHQIDLNIPTLTGKLNGAGSSVVIFPDGMGDDGTNRDELTRQKVIKKVGILDLGSITWAYSTFFYAYFPSDAWAKQTATNSVFNGKCALYTPNTRDNVAGGLVDKAISVNYTGNIVQVRDTSYSDPTVFRTAMNGVKLVYELATPQEYNLDNALQLQYPVVAGGTEMVLPTNGTAPMKMDVIYGNAADATSNLSSNFISVDSMKSFLNNLGTQMGGTWNMQYNNGKFEFTFSSS